MPYADIRDLHLYYEIHGSEAAEPLMLLNGAFDVIAPDSTWGYQLPRLATTYQVISYEPRGHGRTNNPPARFESYSQLADDLLGLVQHLRLGKAHFVAFSDGAITALDFTQRFPQFVDTLVLIGANYCNDETVTNNMKLLTPEYMLEHYPEWILRLQKHHPQSPQQWCELGEQLQLMWAVYPNYTKEEMAQIKVPTLVMSGQYDPYGHVEQTLAIQNAIAKSELCIIPGAAHAVTLQRPEIVTQIILDFLSRQTKKRTKLEQLK
jgi:pimeloyl-ACP methyl ester carboxylesterase